MLKNQNSDIHHIPGPDGQPLCGCKADIKVHKSLIHMGTKVCAKCNRLKRLKK